MHGIGQNNGRGGKIMMSFEEFLIFRDVNIKNPDHERIARLFHPYLYSVTGDKRLLPDLIGQLLDIDLSDTVTRTACLNEIFDGTDDPYEDVDLYVRFQNDIRVFIYGNHRHKTNTQLGEKEYVIFLEADTLTGKIQRANKHIHIR